MPALIPELARAKTEFNRLSASAVNAEILRVDQLRALRTQWETLARRVDREAIVATENIVDEVQEIQELWSSAVNWLREGRAAEEQIRVLEAVAELAGSCRDYLDSVGRMWELLVRMGGQAERGRALAEAGRRLEQVRSEASRALDARMSPWRPSDRARFERGQQEIAEGKAIDPDSARARFRMNQGQA
jgi:hypothetical protein